MMQSQNKMLEISFSSKIEYQDYKQLNLQVSQKILFIFKIIGFIIIAISVLLFVQTESIYSIPLMILGLLFIFGFSFLMSFSIKKNYKSQQRIHERLEYTINEKDIHIQGESFNSTVSWNKIYKVTETNDLIFIFENRLSAYIIPIKNLSNKEYADLKSIIKSFESSKNT